MFGKALAGFAFAMALAMPAGSAFGAGVGAGGGGFGGGGGFASGGGIGVVAPTVIPMGGSPVPSIVIETPRRSPERFRELKLAGHVPADPSKLPKGARIVRLRVNGMQVPMTIDTEQGSAELVFDPTNDYARELYQSILSKQIEVVGDSGMRDQILQTASNPSQPSLAVEGYVFDRASPFLVLKKVGEVK